MDRQTALTNAYTALRLYEQADNAGPAAARERRDALALLNAASARLGQLTDDAPDDFAVFAGERA